MFENYEIIDKKKLHTTASQFEIYAPEIASSTLPGQFVVLMVDEKGERIPLTISEFDRERGIIELVIDSIGVTSKKMATMNIGDKFYSILGPLGKPSDFVNKDKEFLKDKEILLAGGGVGVAPLIPQARWLYENDIDFHVIIGFRSKEFVILEDKFKKYTDYILVTTDDGTYGLKGFVNDGIKELAINRGIKFDLCIIAGPLIMMKFTSLTTKELGIPSIVSMNPIMVDGTGMCGACRVTVDGKTRFACVDGPEFDAHLVDFDEALRRQGQYREFEIEADHKYCELVKGVNYDK